MNKAQLCRWMRQQSPWLTFAVLQFVFWGVMAVGNYQNVYLQSIGFSASTLGVINAALSAVTILATPIWGMFSDRIRSIRRVFLLTLIAGSALFAFIPGVVGLTAGRLPLMLAYLCTVYFFRNPVSSLLDNWLVRYSNQKRLSYGLIRSFGSLGFTVAGLVIAGLIAAKGVRWTFPVCSALMLAVLGLSLLIDDARPLPPSMQSDAASTRVSLNPRVLFREYHYVTFLIFSFLLWSTVNSIMPFLPYLLSELGIPGSRYGVINSYMAFLEIPMLLAAQPMRRWIPLHLLTLVGGACYALAAVLLGVCANSLTSVILIETLHGLGSGLLIASAANYVYTLAPEHLKATGQSFYTAATCLSGILGNLVGGALIDSLGARAFYCILSAVTAFSLLFFIVTLLLGAKRRRQS